MSRKRKKDPDVRLIELTEHERALANRGIQVIAGIDEAGRGPLAGPVVAACVAFQEGTWFPGVDDSKKLSATRRETMYEKIRSEAVAVGVGIADVDTIERINILEATRQASMDAFAALEIVPGHVFTDSLRLSLNVPTTPLVRADSTVYCVAAASIVAKVTRDRLMLELDAIYPEYGFRNNKGYGTEAHRSAILKYGPCPVHRPTFLRKLLGQSGNATERT